MRSDPGRAWTREALIETHGNLNRGEAQRALAQLCTAGDVVKLERGSYRIAA